MLLSIPFCLTPNLNLSLSLLTLTKIKTMLRSIEGSIPMKKYNFGILIAVFGILILPNLSLAETLTVVPTTAASGNEAIVGMSTASCAGSQDVFFLFSPSGNNLNGNQSTNLACPVSSIGWSSTTPGFPTGLTPGNYTIAVTSNNGGGWQTGTNAICGSGATLSTCNSIVVASTTFVVSASSTPPASTTLNSSTFLNWQGILFVKTSETVAIGSSTITQTYDPMDLYWVLLTALIVIFGACYCVFHWMYD